MDHGGSSLTPLSGQSPSIPWPSRYKLCHHLFPTILDLLNSWARRTPSSIVIPNKYLVTWTVEVTHESMPRWGFNFRCFMIRDSRSLHTLWNIFLWNDCSSALYLYKSGPLFSLLLHYLPLLTYVLVALLSTWYKMNSYKKRQSQLRKCPTDMSRPGWRKTFPSQGPFGCGLYLSNGNQTKAMYLLY